MITREILANIRRIEIKTRKVVDDLTAGAYHSVFKGRGMEFNEVREYMEGDEIRTIDWNVTARMGHPYIKKFVEERELTVFLLVDVSASGDFGSTHRSKNEHIAELAALLSFSAIRNNDRVGLLLFSDKDELFVPPKKGKKHVMRLVRELLAHKPQNRKTNIKQALETLLKVVKRKSVVFLISDMIDDHDYQKALNITNKKHDLIGIRILDKHELELPKTGYINLEDAETGELLSFSGGSQSTTNKYNKSAEAYHGEKAKMCKNAGVDLIDIRNGEDYVKPLMQFFRKREKRK